MKTISIPELAVVLVVCAVTLTACGDKAKSETGQNNSAATQDDFDEIDFSKITPIENDEAIQAIDTFIASLNLDKSKPDWREKIKRPPELAFNEAREYHWVLTTNKGELRLSLHAGATPMHVSNLIFLSRVGFYDGLNFHRVIRKFMAQGGCHKGDGSGKLPYALQGEYSPYIKHQAKGTLSAANSGPGTDGSQFFITFKPTPNLDGRHTVYGQLYSGWPVLKEMERVGRMQGAPVTNPVEPITIEKSEIVVYPMQDEN